MINKHDINPATGGLSPLGWAKLAAMGSIALITLGVSVLFLYDVGNTANDYANEANATATVSVDSKQQFRKKYDEVIQVQVDESKKGTNGSGSTKDGNLIADEATGKVTGADNPHDLPLYDGWTLTEEKLKEIANNKGLDSSKITYWDTNYEQFWKDDSFKGTALYKLGDFTGKWNGSKGDGSFINLQTYEGTGYGPQLKNSSSQKRTVNDGNGKDLYLVDERIAVCLPWRVTGYRPALTEEIEKTLNDRRGNVLSTPLFNGKLSYNQWENMIWGDYPGFWDEKSKTLYVDCLLDDGSVIPFIIGDSKGIHVGAIGTKSGVINGYADDVLGQGYTTVRWSKPDANTTGVLHTIEVTGRSNSNLKALLSGKKIVGFRTYYVHNKEGAAYISWMKEAGWY